MIERYLFWKKFNIPKNFTVKINNARWEKPYGWYSSYTRNIDIWPPNLQHY